MHPEQDHACGDVLTVWKIRHQWSSRIPFPPGSNPNAVNASPQTELMQCYVGSRIAGAGLLCVYGNCLLLLVVGAKVGSGTRTTVPQPAALHWITQKMTLLKSFHGTEACMCSPKVCFVPALVLMQGCLLFVAVNILANHFYFGVEIIP